MNADRIQQVATWLAATDIGQLELRGPRQSLVLRHDGGAVDVVAVVDVIDDAALPEAAPPPDTLTVTAPSVGVFLLRHPLREERLAAPGTAVKAGQALGLLQIGLLLLPVPAPANATVHELLVAHGTTVGYGTPLVTLRDAAPR